MTSAISFGLFLTLICLAEGRSLQLNNYDTEDTSLNGPEWEKFNNVAELLSTTNETAQLWAQIFELVIDQTLLDNIWEPYVEAFTTTTKLTENNRHQYTFDASTKALLDKASFERLFVDLVEGNVADDIILKIDVISGAAAEIVSDVPSWLDTQAIEKVDLSQVKLNAKAVLDAIFSNSKVPEKQTKKIQNLMRSIEALSARATTMGKDSAIYVVKLQNYLLKTYPNIAGYLQSVAFSSKE